MGKKRDLSATRCSIATRSEVRRPRYKETPKALVPTHPFLSEYVPIRDDALVPCLLRCDHALLDAGSRFSARINLAVTSARRR